MSTVNITEEERDAVLEDYTTQKFNSVKSVSMRAGIAASRVTRIINQYLDWLKK